MSMTHVEWASTSNTSPEGRSYSVLPRCPASAASGTTSVPRSVCLNQSSVRAVAISMQVLGRIVEFCLLEQ